MFQEESSRSLRALIENEDIPGILREIDILCSEEEWKELQNLSRFCREAAERGRSTWSTAVYTEYRTALEAPAEYAVTVLTPGAGKWSFGPFSEVIAQSHSWESLADYLPGAHIAASVAQERVLRGENLADDVRTAPEIFELPLFLAPQEEEQFLPRYHAEGIDIPDLPLIVPEENVTKLLHTKKQTKRIVLPRIERAWRDIAEVWVTESNGICVSATVQNTDIQQALAHITSEVQIAPISPSQVISRLTWLASSGGAHGHRRGGANGRFMAWWSMSEIGGLEWPPQADFLQKANRLSWYCWVPFPQPHGWCFGLGVEHPDEKWATALLVTDTATETPPLSPVSS